MHDPSAGQPWRAAYGGRPFTPPIQVRWSLMIQTASTRRQFHLIDAEGNDGDRLLLRVPDGVSHLVTGSDGAAPQLLPDGVGAWGAWGAGGTAGGVLLEPVARQRELFLLVVSPPDRPILVNGASAGHLVALQEGDVVQLDENRQVFYLAMHVRSVIGRAPEELADEPCVVCRRELGDSVVYICCGCGHAVHCDTGDGQDALNCMLSDACPSCQAPVRTDGYNALPEDL